MSYSIETVSHLSTHDIEVAAQLTAVGFDRANDAHNLSDTESHLRSADHLKFTRYNGDLVGFAAFRSLLWRKSC